MHNTYLQGSFQGHHTLSQCSQVDYRCHRTSIPGFPTKDVAFKAAITLDNDQFVVDSIIAYWGDPDQRTSMEFEVRFSDGTVV
jgi:hypothetical protein